MKYSRAFIEGFVEALLAAIASRENPRCEGAAQADTKLHRCVQDLERSSGSSAFGSLLRRHRLAAGLTQEALAERARMSCNGIGALERGYRRTPQRQTLALLSDALELIGDEHAQFESAARTAG